MGEVSAVPSETFFRLPEAKREKLEQAAREVFSKVPYESASLNQIIQRAGIPRGSFYMYFADKEELFSYLMTGYAGTVSHAITEQIRASGGDLFAGMLAFYDWTQREEREWEGRKEWRDFFDILRLNGKLRSEQLFPGRDCAAYMVELLAAVDTARLNLERPKDAARMMKILVSLTVGMICAPPGEQNREELIETFSILRRGMEKRDWKNR